MFKGGVPMESRTVGVVERKDAMQPGYTLFCAGLEVYLIDADGRVVHEWRRERPVFVAYLRPNGNLLCDGSENEVAVAFRAGGAAGQETRPRSETPSSHRGEDDSSQR